MLLNFKVFPNIFFEIALISKCKFSLLSSLIHFIFWKSWEVSIYSLNMQLYLWNFYYLLADLHVISVKFFDSPTLFEWLRMSLFRCLEKNHACQNVRKQVSKQHLKIKNLKSLWIRSYQANRATRSNCYRLKVKPTR